MSPSCSGIFARTARTSRHSESGARVDPERDAKLQELRRVLAEKEREAPKDKEGRPNRKALVFTTFSDTAKYLYENLEDGPTKRVSVWRWLPEAQGTGRLPGARASRTFWRVSRRDHKEERTVRRQNAGLRKRARRSTS